MDPARLNGVEAGLVAPPDADALIALVNALSLNPADAQSLLDLAHQARTSDRFGAAPAPQTGQGLLQRAQERSLAAETPTPAAEPTPNRRPGPQTIIRGLRADMVASAIEEAEANRDEATDRT